jgi:ferric-dicitrate binding protein FerR (iron transport regulator)
VNDDVTPRLLRLTPPRTGVARDRADRVRGAVRAEWQAAARRHRERVVARRAAAAAVAGVLATAAALLVAMRLRPPGTVNGAAAPALASVERTVGGGTGMVGRAIVAGQWVQTGPAERIALRLAGGASARLDINSRARIRSDALIELSSGGLYIDSAGAPGGLQVQTSLGTARDVGTQFEVRLHEAALRVRVRSGVVELQHGGKAQTAQAGTEVRVEGDLLTSVPVAPYGADWEWASALAPVFAIEGRPLAAFLQHLAREQGWTLRYADPALAARAPAIVLHGSIEGLTPRDALSVALTSSGLDYRLESGRLLVFRP